MQPVKVRALRTTIAAGAKHEPGTETEVFYDIEENVRILEGKGIVERVHEKKQAPPVENKMERVAADKEEAVKPRAEPPKPKPKPRRRAKK